MQSRALLNLALFLLVVLLAVYIYTSTRNQQASIGSNKLTQMPAEDVVHIVILHNQRRIELDRKKGKWQMHQPVEIDANGFRIDTLLTMLDTASHASYNAADLDMKKYGLDDAGTSISFNDLTIVFGIANPINNYRYVRIGNTVHLIDDHFYPLISSQTGTLIARELIAKNAVIEKLVLPEATLYRDENGLWHSSSGIGPDAISETLYHWKNSQAFGVHNYMQRDPQAEISVYLAGRNEPIQFYVTDTDPWLIIARPDIGIEYHFNLEFYDRLLRPGTSGEDVGELNR